MKKIRNFVIKYHACTLLAISFLFFSCSKDEIPSNREMAESNAKLKSATSKSEFSDEDVFKGIMFLEGKVADKLGDFKELNFRAYVTEDKQISDIISFQNEVIEKIKVDDPKFLSNFRSKVGSGDYYAVKTAIQKAATKISNVATTLAAKNNGQPTTVANKFANSFTSKYNITEKSTKEEVLQAFKKMQMEKTSSKQMPDYYYKYAAVWLFAAAAAVIVIVLVAVQAPTIDEEEVSGYLIDDYQSEVTLELEGI